MKKTWPELEQVHFSSQSLNVLHGDGNSQCYFMIHEEKSAHSQTQIFQWLDKPGMRLKNNINKANPSAIPFKNKLTVE